MSKLIQAFILIALGVATFIFLISEAKSETVPVSKPITAGTFMNINGMCKAKPDDNTQPVAAYADMKRAIQNNDRDLYVRTILTASSNCIDMDMFSRPRVPATAVDLYDKFKHGRNDGCIQVWRFQVVNDYRREHVFSWAYCSKSTNL